ncbi:MAG TPA: hypothetical protein PLK04_01640 [Bacillota bacterium]|jgi:hypothetical protein|nr:hypothetical protein [Bacillota bacterium]HOL50716.1 hypothetical protein [Bacillota bacterium]HOO29512.1 hypothetical protein [Bacillota bacterium]HPQ02858.1 hypothetical protein [Bacillota bacterium]HPZ12921.1 hypothetical protein [Bacillota bacterium]
MVRVALAILRLACVASLYFFLYRVCRALVLDVSFDAGSDNLDDEKMLEGQSAAVPDAGGDDAS